MLCLKLPVNGGLKGDIWLVMLPAFSSVDPQIIEAVYVRGRESSRGNCQL